MTLDRKHLVRAFGAGAIGAPLVAGVGMAIEKPARADATFCHSGNQGVDTSPWTRLQALTAALGANHEPYISAGLCWKDDDGSSGSQEGTDCSGLVGHAWLVAPNYASNGGAFRKYTEERWDGSVWRYDDYAYYRPVSSTQVFYTAGNNNTWKEISEADTTMMDAWVYKHPAGSSSWGHIGIIIGRYGGGHDDVVLHASSPSVGVVVDSNYDVYNVTNRDPGYAVKFLERQNWTT